MSHEQLIFHEKEPLQDHCGIIVEYNCVDTKSFVSCLAGLKKLQTRGYDGAGVFTMNKNGDIQTHIGTGMITEAFDQEVVQNFKDYQAKLWMMQTRYGTNGDWRKENIQPIVRRRNDTGEIFALVHNGQFQNIAEDGTSDTVVFAENLAQGGADWDKLIIKLHQEQRGAWSVAIGTKNALYLLRDPYGIRPLVCGIKTNRLTGQTSYLAASETAGLSAMGAKDFWEVPPGNVIKITEQGIETIYQNGHQEPAPCIFENVYLQNGQTIVHRVEPNRDLKSEPTVESFRRKCGELLALNENLDLASNIDFVVGIPGTGIAGGKAYAQTLGIPYIQAVTDRKPMENDARTFMTQDINEIPNKILGHFYFDANFFPGMNVVLIDDSIVRGNITTGLISLLRDQYKAKEVHIRVLCPPIDKPCHLGINTRKKSELIAAIDTDPSLAEEENLKILTEHVRKTVGADTLTYLSSNDLKKAAGGGNQFCLGCMFGHNPPNWPQKK